MQDILNGLSQSCSDLDSDSFSVSEIKKAAKLLKTKKHVIMMVSITST